MNVFTLFKIIFPTHVLVQFINILLLVEGKPTYLYHMLINIRRAVFKSSSLSKTIPNVSLLLCKVFEICFCNPK